MKYERALTAWLACCVAASGATQAWAIGTTAPTWQTRETVASGIAAAAYHMGADRALAYDHHGNPGIAFYHYGGGDLRYARRVPGVGWSHQTVDTTSDVGRFPSLAYDRYERPAISYFDATNGDLKYVHFNGTSWETPQTVDSTDLVGSYTSLAFDGQGRPAIAYHNSDYGYLRFVHDTDGDLSLDDETPVTVVYDFDEGIFPSLVFDALDRPMITHHDNTNNDLRFSVREPGIGWVTITVDSAGDTGNYPSIDIDPDTGYPAIAYWDNTNDDLRYAEWNGTSWDLTTIDDVGLTGYYPSLAFDPADGNPAIAYMRGTAAYDLKLAWHDGSAWQTQTVDSVGDVGYAPSLAFNDYGTGFPAIAYFEYLSGNDNLFFIEDPPFVPEPASAWLMVLGLLLLTSFRRRLTDRR